MPGASQGPGDPARTFELLWNLREHSGRGRPSGLTVEQITTAAIEVADSVGLNDLSMRSVAERLGVGTMSLYRHVPGKEELLDVMIDRVSAEVVRRNEDGHGDWRSRLEQVGRANRAMFERHPWLLRLFPRRPPQGPGVIAKYDAELRAVEGIGLTDVEMDSALALVLGYVRDATARLLEWKTVSERTGQSDDEWWSTVAPLLDRVLDRERYSLAVRVGTSATTHYEGVHDPEHAYEFGLQRVLDGIESFVNGNSRRSG
ncbi:TetR/AcrR family transcriptional regulator [Plantactinospora soyae]|uniref:AcrR family transcriptional regulator n=1 Tax=Plantactinospora soyae TaxID=1544732 RepID=A0A927R1K0_9ACTN|nr:TetR/AcrR family transcriptional regulator [Plantactinospora soyae]MBE1492825.1 AcrR family transcriptional regulator [Plantactinospora soyae]